jgi:quinol monooxygenase YgiN
MGCSGSKKGETKEEVEEGVIAPLIITVQNKWRDGETKESVSAALKHVGETAMKVEGVIAFQYAINEETKINQVTEIYTDAGVIGKFFEAIGDPAEAFKTIETTNTICCGPKAQVDMAAEAMKGAGFTATLFYTDAVGAACKPPTGPPFDGMPLIMTVQNTWNEGETLETVTAALKAVQEKALTVDGVLAFQYAINEDTKTNQVTEVYTDAAVYWPGKL